MKRFGRFVAFAIGICVVGVVGCGGVDVGGIPVDFGGITNNFGDINLGDVNGIGDAVEEAIAVTEETIVADELKESPHPADVNADFVLAMDEVVAYAADFLDGGLPDGQTQAWVDVASGIALATYDSAYYDDMESPEPDNWKPLLDDAQVDQIEGEEIEAEDTEPAADEVDDVNKEPADEEDEEVADDDEVEDVVDDDASKEATDDADDDASEEADDADAEEAIADDTAAGFDLLFKVVPLTSVPVELEVIDPNGNWNKDWDSLHELGWPEGTAWSGAYTVKVATRYNDNGVNELVTFLLTVWADGEIIHEGEHTAAEGSTWDLVVSY